MKWRKQESALDTKTYPVVVTLVSALSLCAGSVGHGGERDRDRSSRSLRPPAKTASTDNELVLHFAGALNDTASTVEQATVVQCTNVDPVRATDIEVQLFEYNATDMYWGEVSVGPLQTATFESSQVPFYLADVFMDAGTVKQGYGRILADHSRIVCTVQTIDPVNDPPAWGFEIPVHPADLTEERAQPFSSLNRHEIFRFAGVLNDTVSTVEQATVVQCTNVDPVRATDIEVQLFEYNATDMYWGEVSVDPLQTATFESSQVPFYLADVFMDAGTVQQGYGRILAQHSNVICTAQALDPSASPPTWSFDLPLVATGPLFVDGFESGTVSAWSSASF